MVDTQKLIDLFKARYSCDPSLHSFAPGRINLLGEHVDYLGGQVLPAAIDCGISVLAHFDESDAVEIFAVDMDESATWTKADMEKDAPQGWQAYVWGALKESLSFGANFRGGKIIFSGDVPKGSGLSSSAALEVAFANAFLHEQKEIESKELAKLARRVENIHVGTQCGIMDQFASVHGVKDHFLVLNCDTLDYQTAKIGVKGCAWILVNSMVSHNLGDDYNSIRSELESVGEKLGGARLIDHPVADLDAIKAELSESEYSRAHYAITEVIRTAQFVASVTAGDEVNTGKLLQETHWGLSKGLRVSTPELDGLVDMAGSIEGWLGARMMGGGFGGCTINLIRQDQVENFKAKISQQFKDKFGIEPEIYPVSLEDGARVSKL